MRWVLGVVVCLGCVAAPSAALADVDPAGYTVAHQPQIGSCGNVWAKATFTRTWTLKKTGNSRDVWTIDYNGNFTTQAGPSAGACNPVGGASVVAGLHGKIGSHATIHVPHPGGPTFSPLGVCRVSVNRATSSQRSIRPVRRGPTEAPAARPTSIFDPARRGSRCSVRRINL